MIWILVATQLLILSFIFAKALVYVGMDIFVAALLIDFSKIGDNLGKVLGTLVAFGLVLVYLISLYFIADQNMKLISGLVIILGLIIIALFG